MALVKETTTLFKRMLGESDYQTTAHLNYSRRIQFKFSINEQDNEAFAGGDHVVYINSEHESPIITFGTFSNRHHQMINCHSYKLAPILLGSI